MARTISNSDDVINLRDIIKRIAELEAIEETFDDNGTPQGDGRDEDEEEELRVLKALAEEAKGYAADWKYGATLIRDSYFKEYAEQLADDTGAVDRDAGWPMNCIDWDKAADELQADYSSVDFDGVTYWIR